MTLCSLMQYAKNKFLSRATAIVSIGPRQIGKAFGYVVCWCRPLFKECLTTPSLTEGPALPLLGFSSEILGFSIESWVLGYFPEGLGFVLGLFQRPWVFITFHPKIHLFHWFFGLK